MTNHHLSTISSIPILLVVKPLIDVFTMGFPHYYIAIINHIINIINNYNY